MLDAEALLGMVQRIYNAALSPAGWTPALDGIRTLFDGDHVMLLTRRIVDGETAAVAAGVDGTPFERAVDYVRSGGDDIGFLRMEPSNGATATAALISDADFARTTLFNDVIRPMGGFRAVLIQPAPSSRYRAFLAVCHPRRRPDYTPREIDALALLNPHIRQTLRLGQRLAHATAAASGMLGILERLDRAVIAVDAGCGTLFLNDRAAAMIARADGLSASSAGLEAALPNETRALRGAVAALTTTGTASPFGPDDLVRRAAAAADTRLSLSRPSGGLPLAVTITPAATFGLLDDGIGLAGAAAILFVTDPDLTPALDDAALRSAFGLTPREASVAARLAAGLTIDQIAADFGLRRESVRGYVKALREKTGTRRQADLVRLLLRGFGRS